MRTSAAGNSAAGASGQSRYLRHLRHSGFTLLELIVVVAIMALATAGVGLAMRGSSETALAREADRLVALLESARVQSRTTGTPVYWRATPQGPAAFVFEGLQAGTLPTAWLSGDGMSARATDGEGRSIAALQLGPEPIIAAQQVVLAVDGPPARSLRIATDGLRPFAVSAAP